MKKISKFILISSLILLPIFAFAVYIDPTILCPDGSPMDETLCGTNGTLTGFFIKIYGLLELVVPILVLLGVVYFVWGVVRYVIADGEEAKKRGKDIMIWGIIGLAVIVGLWGLVAILVNTFNLDATVPSLEPLTGAQATCTLEGDPKLQDVFCYATRIINDSVIPLIFAVGAVFFVWGAVKFFIIDAGEEAKRAQGRQFMIWGIITFAVMLSVWGLAGILTKTFGVESSTLPQVKP